jgi:ketosteroid isomerase-like protein
MSEENVELIRQIYDAWDRGESARAYIAGDVKYVNPVYAVEPGTRYGRNSFAVIRSSYEDFKLQIEQLIDAGGDDVVVLAHYTGTGSSSGVRVAGEHGYVWTVREGLAVRFRWFQSHAEALEAAGLSE